MATIYLVADYYTSETYSAWSTKELAEANLGGPNNRVRELVVEELVSSVFLRAAKICQKMVCYKREEKHDDFRRGWNSALRKAAEYLTCSAEGAEQRKKDAGSQAGGAPSE